MFRIRQLARSCANGFSSSRSDPARSTNVRVPERNGYKSVRLSRGMGTNIGVLIYDLSMTSHSERI